MNTDVLRNSRNLIKRALAAFVYYSGIARIYCAVALRRRGVVLMYHRVLPEDALNTSYSAAQIIVTTTTFEAQMRFLRRRFNPVSAQQFASMLNGTSPWQPRTCLVTFDDGWWDNAEHALPVLQRHGVPAVVFVATGYIGTQRCFWQETLTALLCELAGRGSLGEAFFEKLHAAEILAMNPKEARTAVRTLVSQLKQRSPDELERLIGQVRALLDRSGEPVSSNATDRFMSWAQVLSLQQSGLIEIGSHAHSHTPLPKLTDQDIAAELEAAHREIERQLNRPPKVFAYPNGDYHDGAVRRVAAMGYDLAFTTDTGWVQAGDPPLRLKRVNISEAGTASAPGFLCRLLAWF